MPIAPDVDFAAITALFHEAHAEGRGYLYQHEVYALLAKSGAETPPQANLLARGARPTDEELTAIPGDNTVRAPDLSRDSLTTIVPSSSVLATLRPARHAAAPGN